MENPLASANQILRMIHVGIARCTHLPLEDCSTFNPAQPL